MLNQHLQRIYVIRSITRRVTNQTYQLEMKVPGVPLVLVQEMRRWLELGPGLYLGLFLLVVCPPSLDLALVWLITKDGDLLDFELDLRR